LTLPKDTIHALDSHYEHRDLHNLYGHYVLKSVFEGLFWRSDSAVRPVIATRSFYAGSQRYGITWTGNFEGHWRYLKASIPMALSISVSGMPYVGVNTQGLANGTDTELIVRWFQMGSVMPMFLNYIGAGVNQPLVWDLPAEAQAAVRDAINLRYKLIPHLYSEMKKMLSGELPLMRPMFMEFPEIAELYDLDDQYMLGPYLLVKPITEPGITKTQIYFPTGIWYNFNDYTRHYYEGWTEIEVTLEHTPIYVRGGSILLLSEHAVTQSDESLELPYTIVIGVDGNNEAHGTFYTDDGATTGLFDGKSVLSHMSVEGGKFIK